MDENEFPGDFEISVESITSHSALLKWSGASSQEDVAVLYDVYLNNEIIAEGLEQLELPLENLDTLTLYEAKVIAKNTYGQSENTIEFTTIEIEENPIPGDFEVTVESITSYSALLKWTAATPEVIGVLYDVYLNNDVIAEGLDLLELSLENLNQLTIYEAKVIAKNEYGESESTIEFSTMENPRMLLKSYSYGNGYYTVLLDYDDAIQIERKRLFEQDTTTLSFMDIYYNYNSDGSIEKERFYNRSVYGETKYYYTADIPHKIIDRVGSGDEVKHDYSFNGDLTYYSDIFTDGCYTCDPDIITILYEHENFVSFNGEGQMVNLETKDLNGNLVGHCTFEYTNGNLTKLTDITNSDIWEFSYDDKPNFNTYFTGIKFLLYENTLGLMFLDRNLSLKLQGFPLLYKFSTNNNPTEYKLNGATYQTLQYIYNEYDLPSFINASGSVRNTQVKLNYEEAH